MFPPSTHPGCPALEQAANGKVRPYLPPSRAHALLLLGCSRALGCWHCFFFPFFFPFEKKSIEESFFAGGKIWTMIEKYTDLGKQVEELWGCHTGRQSPVVRGRGTCMCQGWGTRQT